MDNEQMSEKWIDGWMVFGWLDRRMNNIADVYRSQRSKSGETWGFRVPEVGFEAKLSTPILAKPKFLN